MPTLRCKVERRSNSFHENKTVDRVAPMSPIGPFGGHYGAHRGHKINELLSGEELIHEYYYMSNISCIFCLSQKGIFPIL
jgi:hypothetical protein